MNSNDNITLQGLATEHIAIAGETLKINHARYRITNHTDEAVNCALRSLVYRNALAEKEIESWHTYLLPDYEELDASEVRIQPGESIEIECSFAPLEVSSPDAGHEVILRLESEDDVYSATDEIMLVTRFPR